MPSGRIRSTRMLRSWMVEQVSSGKYIGLIWDDDAKTMFRIPWKHAGKQDFRSEEDAAIFKAWAEFKGKLLEGGREDPASWKTRLRCALNKSPEFREVPERSQLDISEPYKVYLLVPISEQRLTACKSKCRVQSRKQKRRTSESESEEEIKPKQMKEEAHSSPPINICVQAVALENDAIEELPPPTITMKREDDEYHFNLRIETTPSARDSFHVSVNYLGQEVANQDVRGNDVRITYLPPAPDPPTTMSLMGGFPRILLPEPTSTLVSNSESSIRLQALTTLLPYMERGVMLTCTESGVYAKRFCQGRVFWTGPHSSLPGPQKMDRNVKPVMLFSREMFKQSLDHFRMNGGDPPQCDITLCFGEEFSSQEEPSSKLIIVQVTLPWAQKDIEDTQSIIDSMTLLANLASQSPTGEITLNLELVPST